MKTPARIAIETAGVYRVSPSPECAAHGIGSPHNLCQHRDTCRELLALLKDCESYAYAMGMLQGSGEGTQLAARCRALIARAAGTAA